MAMAAPNNTPASVEPQWYKRYYYDLCRCHKSSGHPPDRIPMKAIVAAANDGGCTICRVVQSALVAALNGNIDPDYSVVFKLKYNGELVISYMKEREWATEEKFEVYLAQGQPKLPAPLEVMGNFREVFDDPGSPECLERIKEMLRHCETSHQDCKPPISSRLPRRVLDMGTGSEQGATIRLHISECDQRCDYLALSHCWGDSQPLTTTTTTLGTRQQGIDWADLPVTFQDAISITRALGKRFLWIDSLCIIQDDRDDWTVESAKMGDIYENAYLTLAASASTSATGGTLVKRTRHLSKYFNVVLLSDKSVGIQESSNKKSYGNSFSPFCRGRAQNSTMPNESMSFKVRKALGKHYRHDIPGRIRDSFRANLIGPASPMDPLETRAWTFQERLVSRRLLSFREKELEWDCSECCDCECGARFRSFWADGWDFRNASSRQSYQGLVNMAILLMKTTDKQPDLDKWREHMYTEWALSVVTAYTQLKLTHESDRLPALSAIARRMEVVLGDSYICGLWRNHLADGMTWKSGAYGTNPPSPGKLPNGYRAPSWSWASIEGPVDACCDREDAYEPIFRVQEANSSPATRNRYGDVASATAIVQGRVVPGILNIQRMQGGKLEYGILINGAGKGNTNFWPDTTLTFCNGTWQRTKDGDVDSMPLESSAPVRCLAVLMARIRGNRGFNCGGQGEVVDFEAARWITFMVLTPSRRVGGGFERIGLVTSYQTLDMPDLWHEKWLDTTVTLV